MTTMAMAMMILDETGAKGRNSELVVVAKWALPPPDSIHHKPPAPIPRNKIGGSRKYSLNG